MITNTYFNNPTDFYRKTLAVRNSLQRQIVAASAPEKLELRFGAKTKIKKSATDFFGSISSARIDSSKRLDSQVKVLLVQAAMYHAAPYILDTSENLAACLKVPEQVVATALRELAQDYQDIFIATENNGFSIIRRASSNDRNHVLFMEALKAPPETETKKKSGGPRRSHVRRPSFATISATDLFQDLQKGPENLYETVAALALSLQKEVLSKERSVSLPSRTDIKDVLGTDMSTVQAAVNTLQAFGFLEDIGRSKKIASMPLAEEDLALFQPMPADVYLGEQKVTDNRQVKRQVKTMILNAAMRHEPSYVLPTAEGIAEHIGVNSAIVRLAVDELCDDFPNVFEPLQIGDTVFDNMTRVVQHADKSMPGQIKDYNISREDLNRFYKHFPSEDKIDSDAHFTYCLASGINQLARKYDGRIDLPSVFTLHLNTQLPQKWFEDALAEIQTIDPGCLSLRDDGVRLRRLISDEAMSTLFNCYAFV